MKPSDLPWWGWLLAAATLAFVAIDGLVGMIGKPAEGRFSIAVAFALLAVSIVLAIVGLIRFLKWTWKD